MIQYAMDIRGKYWRKDLFKSYCSRKKDGEYVIHATYCDPGSEYDETVEFSAWSWNNPYLGEPVFLPCLPGYSAVYTWFDDESEEFGYDVRPVLAWRVISESELRPIVAEASLDDLSGYPVIVHPDGQVAEYDRTWPSVDEFLADRESALRAEAERKKGWKKIRAEQKAA